MSITALPTPPSRSDPTNFAVRGDAFLGALPTFGDEANALALDVNTKQSTASTAATTATTQAGIATTKAGEAAASAAAALQSENDAYDLVEFYLGASATDPTTGRLGAALIAGNWYINSSSGFIRAYTGSAWVNGVSSISGVSSVNGLTGNVTDIATTNTAQTLTNKTLSAATNNIEARALKSATTTISVSGASAPTTGQVLTATSGTNATWQTVANTGSLVYLSTVTATGAATVDIEAGFSSTYDDYLIVATEVYASVSATSLLLRLKINGTYATGATNYHYHSDNSASSASTYAATSSGGAGAAQIQIGSATALSGGSTQIATLQINVFGANAAGFKNISSIGQSGFGLTKMNCSGTAYVAGGLSGVRLYAGTGTLSGIYKLYGIKKA